MARFYANIRGNRGEATRMGSAASGITAHPRGWDVGVKVTGHPFAMDAGRDEFEVRASAGSNGGGFDVPVAVVRITAEGDRLIRHFDPDGNIIGEYRVDRGRRVLR